MSTRYKNHIIGGNAVQTLRCPPPPPRRHCIIHYYLRIDMSLMRLYLLSQFILSVSISVHGIPPSGMIHTEYLAINRYIAALNEAEAFQGANRVATHEKTVGKCVDLALDTLISRTKVMKRTPVNIQAISFTFSFDPTKGLNIFWRLRSISDGSFGITAPRLRLQPRRLNSITDTSSIHGHSLTRSKRSLIRRPLTHLRVRAIPVLPPTEGGPLSF
ncbi:hypothetical protein IW262DRAFT_676360 [Armillaria fumosa]|nr:hypothetical protein IW262DRAFT_676360 [Armillaria fumosa]